MGRRGYPPEFRRRALDLLDACRKVVDLARGLGISNQTIYAWRRQEDIDRGLVAGLTSAEREELAAAKRRIRELETRRDDFDRRLAKTPGVEREYRALAREYENAQLKYQEVRNKQREADASQDLEAQRKGERFTLIEPPLPPEQPVSPNRPVVLALGLLASAGLALGAMGFADALDGSIRGAHDLARLVEVAPLAAIPVIRTEEERGRDRRQRRRGWLVALAVAVALIVLVHVFVRPLDVLWLSLARRLGL